MVELQKEDVSLIPLVEAALLGGFSVSDLLHLAEEGDLRLRFSLESYTAQMVNTQGEPHPHASPRQEAAGIAELLPKYASRLLRFGTVEVCYFPVEPEFLSSIPPVRMRRNSATHWNWVLTVPQRIQIERVLVAKDLVVGKDVSRHPG